MPMYYPDLKSVREIAIIMSKKEDIEERYLGIIPKKELDLPEARRQLGEFFRDVLKDEVGALEIELALTPENYEEKLKNAIINSHFGEFIPTFYGLDKYYKEKKEFPRKKYHEDVRKFLGRKKRAPNFPGISVIYGKRRTGRTTKLIEWLFQDEMRILLVETEQERVNLCSKYPELARRIETTHRFLRIKHGSYLRDYEIAIDNIEFVIRYLFGKVVLFSMEDCEGEKDE